MFNTLFALRLLRGALETNIYMCRTFSRAIALRQELGCIVRG